MRARLATLSVVGVSMLAACGGELPTSPALDAPSLSVTASAPTSYIVLAPGNGIRDGLAADLAVVGGSVTAQLPQIGLVVVESADPAFAARATKLRGVQAVAADPAVQWYDPDVAMESVTDAAHTVGSTESFRLIQWAPDAVSAPAAWDAGALGRGARVAILDGGIYSAHLDLAPNLDVAASRSFVPGQAYNTDTGTFWHGTHVAGIVAAAANGIGTVGIAPEATLIGVKVLHSGSGSFSWVIQGILYAATPVAEGGAGAHVINMSLGAGFPRQGSSAAQLANALSRATTWAYQQGTLVVASAGNSAVDLDHTANLIFIPGQSTNVVNVSATGPRGWALGSTDLDRPASYTNFGQSAITLAGPGGDSALPGNQICSKPRLPSGAVVVPCWVFDMVMSTVRGAPASLATYGWASGTSMAAPAVSGVAALVVGQRGPMHPAQLEAILRASADDLGKPGNDDFYGRGRVNAYRAISH